jgi:hypothetical protein
LLELIAARSSYGVRTELSPVNNAPLADVKDPREFKFLVDHLAELGYLIIPLEISSRQAKLYGLWYIF